MKNLFVLIVLSIMTLLTQSIAEGLLCGLNFTIKNYQDSKDLISNIIDSYRAILFGFSLLVPLFRLAPFIGAFILLSGFFIKTKDIEIVYKRIAITHIILSIGTMIPFLIMFKSFEFINITITVVISVLLAYSLKKYKPFKGLISTILERQLPVTNFKSFIFRLSIAAGLSTGIFYIFDYEDGTLEPIWGLGLILTILLLILTIVLYVPTLIKKII